MLILEYLPAVLPFLDEVSLLKAAVYLGVMIALPVGGKLLYDRLRGSLLKKAAEEKPVGKKAAEDSASLLEKPPFKGGSSPTRVFSRVDLPIPLKPVIAIFCPLRTSKLISLMTG